MPTIDTTHCADRKREQSVSEITQGEKTTAAETVPSYGLLIINHAYNEGKLTFKEWLDLSREWALKIIEQYKERAV